MEAIDLKIEKLDGRIRLMMSQLAVLIGGVAALVITAFA
jgi:hypothetical protein